MIIYNICSFCLAAPIRVKAQKIGASYISLTWNKAQHAKEYTVMYKAGYETEFHIKTATGNAIQLTKLDPGTTYEVMVRLSTNKTMNHQVTTFITKHPEPFLG